MEIQNYVRQDSATRPNRILKRFKILLVEDDMTYRPIWEFILDLAEKNSQFEWVTSGAEATRRIERSQAGKNKFDLIISDIFLHGPITGLDLWARYHTQFREKMILISGIDPMRLRSNMKVEEIFPSYLRKPLKIEECIETVYGLLHPLRY